MNDPNGCFKNPKTGEWNLYFQYCGLRTVWCAPMFWGHAISYDMNTWVEKDLAIGPPDHESGVFSGSIFIDEENESVIIIIKIMFIIRINGLVILKMED